MPTLNINNDVVLFPSANVGIKATPSAWASGYSVLNVGDAAAISWTGAGANDFSFSTNAYYDTTDNRWEYRGTGDGSARYSMTALSYEHRWYNAPVGTANAAISYTQAMTLTGGGNLLIGTTTDSGYKLNVNGDVYTSSNYGLNALGDYAARYRTYAPADGNWGLLTYAADPEYHMVITGASSGDSGANRQFRIYDRPTSNTRFVVNFSNGYTGIGTAAPTRSLHVVGTTRHERVYAYANNTFQFTNDVPSNSLWLHLGTQASFTTDKIYYRVNTQTSEEEGEIIVSNTCVEPLVEWHRNSYNVMVTAVKARMQGSCQPCEIWIQVRYGSNYGGANTTVQWQVHSGTDGGFTTVNATGTPGTGTNEKNLTNTDGYFYETSGNIKAPRYSNAGFLGTGQNNARNHFTPLGAGSASPATGWIAAAFGDALADRIVIGQWTNGAQQAIFGAHTANLDDWADTNYVSKNHKFYYNGDWSITPALTINTSGNVLIGTTTDAGIKLDVNGTGRFSGGVLYLGNYSVNPELTLQATNNSWSKINFYDNNNTEGLYIRTDGASYGGTMTFGARWDDDEGKVFFKMFQSSAGATYDVKLGVNTGSPETMLHLAKSSSSNDISGTPSIIITNRDSTSGTFVSGGIFNNPYRDVSTSSVTAGVWFENQNSPDAGALAKSSAVVFGANSYSANWNLPTERMRITQGGLVGVGTSNPLSKFDVSLESGQALFIANEAGTISDGDLLGAVSFGSRDGSTYSSGGITNIRSYATATYNTGSVSGDMRFYVSSSLQNTTQAALFGQEAMRITAGGNLLIGTTTDAGYKVNLSGDINVSGAIRLAGGGATVTYISESWGINLNGSATQPTQVRSSSFSVGYVLGAGTNYGTGNMFVAGSVGIGELNPTQLLHLTGTNAANNGITIQNTNASGNSQVRFLNASGVERAAITYINAADAIYMYTSAGGNLLNLVGGNVLIGTTTDNGAKLNVNGTSYINGAASFGSTIDVNGNVTLTQDTNDLIFQQTNSSTHGIVWKNTSYTKDSASIRPTGNGAWATQGIGFYTGNVGNSTTAPTIRFNIEAGGNITMFGANNHLKFDNWSDDNNYIQQTKPDGTVVGYMGFDGYSTPSAYYTDYVVFTRPSGGSLTRRIYVSQTGAMSLQDATGNVLIGTTTDSGYKLDVVTGADGSVMRLLAASGNQTYFGFDPSGGYIETNGASTGRQKLRLQSYNGSAYTQLFIDGGNQYIYTSANTNFGVGTGSPAYKLDVSGSARVNSTSNLAMFVKTNSAFGAAISYEDSTTGGNDVVSAGAIGGAFYIGTNFSEQMRVSSAGNVIIGSTTDAGYKLDVYGEILGRDDIRILNTYALVLNGTDANWRIGRNTITDTGWLTGNTMQMVVFGSSSGQGFQVVNHNGTALFEIDGVAGASRFTNALGVGVNPSGTAGRIDASNDIVAYSTSDQRLKENITPIANALDKVKALTGVEFDWKEETKDVHGYEGHDVGVIAQEVQSVLPEAVRTNDSGYLSVRYEKMIALLVEANKELASRIEELEKKLK